MEDIHHFQNDRKGDIIDDATFDNIDSEVIVKAYSLQSWERINVAYKNNETLSCYIKSRTKGGMIVLVFGIEAFLPSSQIDIIKVHDFDRYIGTKLDVKIIKINEELKSVVVSHRIIMSENLQKKDSDKSLLKEIWQKHTEVQ